MLQNEVFVTETVAAAVLVRVGLRSLGSRRFVWFLLMVPCSGRCAGRFPPTMVGGKLTSLSSSSGTQENGGARFDPFWHILPVSA